MTEIAARLRPQSLAERVDYHPDCQFCRGRVVVPPWKGYDSPKLVDVATLNGGMIPGWRFELTLHARAGSRIVSMYLGLKGIEEFVSVYNSFDLQDVVIPSPRPRAPVMIARGPAEWQGQHHLLKYFLGSVEHPGQASVSEDLIVPEIRRGSYLVFGETEDGHNKTVIGRPVAHILQSFQPYGWGT